LLATKLLGVILWPPLSLAIGGMSILSGLSIGEFNTVLAALLS